MSAVTRVSSDPHAWLRPIYARLRADPSFARLSSSHQFTELVRAAAEVSLSQAVTLREYNDTTQMMLLGWINDVVNEKQNPKRKVELWRVRKDQRELRCVAVYLPSGILVRLMEAVSDEWQRKLAGRGWTTVAGA